MVGPIGFEKRNEMPPVTTETSNIPFVPQDKLDSEFQGMIQELQLEEKLLTDELRLDKKLRLELVVLFKRVKEMESNILKRNQLMATCEGNMKDFPEKSLKLLKNIDEMDQTIIQEVQQIFNELSKHQLKEVADIYKSIEVSDEEKKHINALATTLSYQLSYIVEPIQRSFNREETETIRRNLLANNPKLR